MLLIKKNLKTISLCFSITKFERSEKYKNLKKNILESKQINKSSEFLDDNTLIEKNLINKYNLRSLTNAESKNIQTNEINKIDFAELTNKFQDIDIENILLKNKFPEKIEELIPWYFNLEPKLYLEKNLLSIVNIENLITEENVISIFKEFLLNITNYNLKGMEKIVENKFCSKLNDNFNKLKYEGYKLKLKNLEDIDKTSIDLFNVENIFGVGIFTNRKRNYGMKHYIINESFINKVPITEIVLKKPAENELAKYFIHLHLSLKSPIKIEIINKNNVLICEEKKSVSDHLMILEILISQCDYHKLKKVREGSDEKMKNLDFKKNDPSSNMKIIDFDGFMKGNSFIINKINI